MNATDLKVKNAPLLSVASLRAALHAGELDGVLTALGSAGGAPVQRQRCLDLLDTFAKTYGDERDVALFTVSGRSELSGNHTDHNHGCVVACSITLDMLGVAAPRADGVIRLTSAGFDEDIVDINTYTAPDGDRFGTSASLIAGVCAGFVKEGYAIGGFDACVVSDVFKGSGLSSSAAFEDMIGTIESHLYNGGRVDEVSVSRISQYAENAFFGKPCGLMDQVACAVGGIVAIDFGDPKAPVIEPIAFDMTEAGYQLCIVNTGGNHADLTDDYAAVPAEMKAVAAVFGKEVLRDVDEANVVNAIPTLRERLGDRAILRAMHFFAENRRVAAQKQALMAASAAKTEADRNSALSVFFENVRASGRSSFCYLQNVYTTKNPVEQGLSLALCLCESVLDGEGAFRVHGGGFAGTVQAFVPNGKTEVFRTAMDAAFGRGACTVLGIRAVGAARIR